MHNARQRRSAESACLVNNFYGRSKAENGRTKLFVLGQIVHTVFKCYFIHCSCACEPSRNSYPSSFSCHHTSFPCDRNGEMRMRCACQLLIRFKRKLRGIVVFVAVFCISFDIRLDVSRCACNVPFFCLLEV